MCYLYRRTVLSRVSDHSEWWCHVRSPHMSWTLIMWQPRPKPATRRYEKESSVCVSPHASRHVLRGPIVNRAYGVHTKKLPGTHLLPCFYYWSWRGIGYIARMKWCGEWKLKTAGREAYVWGTPLIHGGIFGLYWNGIYAILSEGKAQ